METDFNLMIQLLYIFFIRNKRNHINLKIIRILITHVPITVYTTFTEFLLRYSK